MKLNRKHLTTLLATLLLATLSHSTIAYDFMVGGIAYNINSDGRSVTVTYTVWSPDSNYSGLTTANIPANVAYNGKTYSVTSIGNYAFSGCTGLTSVTIPNSVTSLGVGAFGECYGLTSIEIPNSVTSIGSNAFQNCFLLTTVTIPNRITSIGSMAFSGCENLTNIYNYINHPEVVTLGYDVFVGVPMAFCDLHVPKGTESIYREAEQWKYFNIIADLDAPANTYDFMVDGIAYNINSDRRSVTVTYTQYNSSNNYSGLTAANIPSFVTYGGKTYSVITIGESAFSGCKGLTSVTIPNSLTSIGGSAFSGCSGLTSVTIPNSVTEIGTSAFSGCTGLTSVTIPNSVTSIGDYAFRFCSGLTNLTITGNGSWNTVLSGRNYSDIKTLKVGSEITDISGFGLNPDTVSSYAPVPPTCTGNTFTAYDAELHVPTTSIAAYFTAPYWSNFSNIINNLTEKVMLSQTEAEGIASDEFMLKATTIPADKEDEVVWSTSNPAVATVAEDGKMTLQSKGECRIFASLSSDLAVYASCLVKVNSSIKLDKTEATIAPNEMLVLTPTYDVADIAATSSDASVAIARVVTSDGVKKVQVVGVNYGTATITVASTEGDAPPATCKISVRDTVSSDVNGDGRVNVSDVSALINMILGITPMDQTTGDVNGDGRVNVSDVSALINIILGIQ